MDEPIINPWIFYLIEILGCIKTLSCIICIILFITFFLGLEVIYFENFNFKKYKKYIITMVTVFIICLLFTIFIPTKKTIYTMIIAKNITYEKVDKAINIGKDIKNTVKQDIIEIIKELNKKD